MTDTSFIIAMAGIAFMGAVTGTAAIVSAAKNRELEELKQKNRTLTVELGTERLRSRGNKSIQALIQNLMEKNTELQKRLERAEEVKDAIIRDAKKKKEQARSLKQGLAEAVEALHQARRSYGSIKATNDYLFSALDWERQQGRK